MSLYPGDPSPANAPAPAGALPSQRGESPIMGTALTIQESPLKSFLRKLWRPVEQKLGLEGSILLMLGLAAAGVITVIYLLSRFLRK